jgi:hypothetical protein
MAPLTMALARIRPVRSRSVHNSGDSVYRHLVDCGMRPLLPALPCTTAASTYSHPNCCVKNANSSARFATRLPSGNPCVCPPSVS